MQRWASQNPVPFQPGNKVQLRSDPSRIGIVEALERVYGGLSYHRVFWGGPHGSRVVAEVDLVPYMDNPSPAGLLARGIVAGYAAFQRTLTLHRLLRDHPLRNNIYAFNASRTRFYPYQFKPLIKFLDSPNHRLLICDEVGLGKTIEAGLILCELRARQDLRTVLVVCPASLVEKWKLELDRRFEEDFKIHRSGDLDHYLHEYEADPDRKALSGIVALETLRTSAVLERLEALTPSFDLVIFDEAHHVRNFGTKSRRAVAALAEGAGAFLMLTATPIHLGTHNLFSLLNLLDAEDFPDPETADRRFAENEPLVRVQRMLGNVALLTSDGSKVLADALADLDRAGLSPLIGRHPAYPTVRSRMVDLANGVDPDGRRRRVVAIQRDLADLNLLGHIFTRTRKRDVHMQVAVRQPQALVLTFSPEERAMYSAITEVIRGESERRASLPTVEAFRLHIPQRRMASSIHAMVEHYRRADPFDLEDTEEDLADLEFEEAADGLGEARARLKALLAAWHDGVPDSKLAKLLETLNGVRERGGPLKVLVFATFRATLDYLSRRLAAEGFRAAVIHGGIAPRDRVKIIRDFREDEDLQILLSSRVGSEGLDFEFCSTLVNYDLPWNPVELEQRIGRLDRIGQESPVITILNMAVEDTIETRILLRLYDRVGIFQRAIGDLDGILGDLTRSLEQTFLSGRLTPEQEEAKLEQILVATEQRRADLERLEEESGRFLGSDAFFEEEIAAITAKRRYVTGEQLRRFLVDFLETYARGTRLSPTSTPEVLSLVPDQHLRTFIQNSGRAGALTGLLVSGRDGRRVTFDSEVAYAMPGIEFLNVRHPLVLAVADFFKGVTDAGGAAFHVVLQERHAPTGVAPGRYFLFVYRLRVTSARGGNTLEVLVRPENRSEVLDADLGETLLGAIVEAGEEPEGHLLAFMPGEVERAFEEATDEFTRRIELRRSEVETTNNALLDRRKASYEGWYRKRMRQQEERLRTGRQERYLRMIRTTIARLEAERRRRLAEFEQVRAVSLEYDELAAAVVDVVS